MSQDQDSPFGYMPKNWPREQDTRTTPKMMPNGRPWPRITVVTPSYNQDPFIEETICSVLGQNYPNLEYIIMDGGSTDQTVQIIEKYQTKIDYWESKKDQGQSHAINKGFRRATGEIVAWLNSDDIYLPEALFTIAEAFSQYPEAGFVYGVCVLTDIDGRFLRSKGADWDYGRLLRRTYFGQPATFMRREVVAEVGYVDEDLFQVLDWELWVRLGFVATGQFIEAPLATSRMWEGTKTSSTEKNLRDEHIGVLECLRNKQTQATKERRELINIALAERKWGHGNRNWQFKYRWRAASNWWQALRIAPLFILQDFMYPSMIRMLPPQLIHLGIQAKKRLQRA